MDSARTQIAYPDGCKCSLDVQRKPHGNDDGMHRSEDRLWRSLVGRDLACAIIIVYHTTTDRIKRRVQHARKRHGSDILVGNFNKSQRPTRSCRRRVSFAICSRAFASHLIIELNGQRVSSRYQSVTITQWEIFIEVSNVMFWIDSIWYGTITCGFSHEFYWMGRPVELRNTMFNKEAVDTMLQLRLHSPISMRIWYN